MEQAPKIYNPTRAEKIKDFLLGFFGIGIINSAVILVITLLMIRLVELDYFSADTPIGLIPKAVIVIGALEFLYFIRIKRNFLAYGIIAQVLTVAALFIVLLSLMLLSGEW
jgi:hypothetical protein